MQDTIQIEEVTTKRKDTTYVWKIRYNKFGELIDESPREKKEFDENGNLTKVVHEGLKGVFSSFSIVYDYDHFNNKVRETEYDSMSNVVKTKMLYYNEKNELVQKIQIDSTGTEIKRIDESGYVYEYSYIPFNEEENRFHGFWRNFDKYGNVIKRVDINKDQNGKLVEQISRIELEYDEIGNWHAKRVYRNDSLTINFERKIKYY